MATINNFIISLTQKLGLNNLPSVQRTFDANLTFALAKFQPV
jgi:hypothetical protein